MAIKPILFSGPMVRALLDGRKAQTRRILSRLGGFGKITEFGPSNTTGYDWHFRDRAMRWQDLQQSQLKAALPYRVGDFLWVKEAWRASPDYDAYPPRELSHWPIHYEADGEADQNLAVHMCGRRRASIHMPRWASRLTLRVTEVRVQRLQEISEVDARAEAPVSEYTVGQARADEALSWDNISPDAPDDAPLYIAEFRDDDSDYALSLSARDGFSALWDSLNAERDGGAFSWASNPWVVAVSYEVVAANIDQVIGGSA